MTAQPQKTSRILWADVAKGVAIILVVCGHTWHGLYMSGLEQDRDLACRVIALIYQIPLPVFFVVSGVFFERSIRRAGVVPSFLKRIEGLLYPLVLWSYVLASALLLAGNLTSRPAITVTEALLYPFPPKDLYWFLWAMFLIQGVASLIVTWSTRVLAAIWVVTMALVVFVGVDQLPEILRTGAVFFPYVLAGMVLARLPNRLGDLWPGFAGLAIFLAMEVWGALNPDKTDFGFGLAASLGGGIGLIYFIAWATPRLGDRIRMALQEVGAASMAIYVSHVLGLAAVRIALEKIGVTAIPVHIVAGIAFGLLPSLLLYEAARRYGFMRILGFGRDIRPNKQGAIGGVPAE